LNVSVGLIEGQSAVEVELTGMFTDIGGKPYSPGRHRLTSEVALTPSEPASCAFALDDITIGIGFHWERKERQVFRGALRLIKREAGLTVIKRCPARRLRHERDLIRDECKLSARTAESSCSDFA